MSATELRFLGDFEVLREGQALALPPSRKTRALLAYLSMNPRRFRREFLCELLWDIPDDPRGSLRWSLSKLRRLVDTPERKRIVADRASVGFDPDGLIIDVVELYGLAEQRLANATVAALEAAARQFRGNFLEGLEFSGFHDFHAWCVAERERTVGAQAAILDELTARLADEPERALPHARALVAVSPYDETFRARLIKLLVGLRHAEEAEQHYRLGERMLKELGAESTGILYRALHGAPGRARQAAPPEESAPAPQAKTVAAGPELVGRSAELGQVSGLLEQVMQTGRAGFVLVRGEPGIGKSSLLAAVRDLAGAAEAFLLEASAYETTIARPFALWIDALRGLGAEAADAIFGEHDQENRDRLLGDLSAFIREQSGRHPVVLSFDDFQWSDESSAAALHYVARMNRDRPLLGVIAARSGELRDNAQARQAVRDLRHDGVLREISLGPLPEADIRKVIALRAPDADAERASRECGGNPLLAIELARAERQGGSGGSLDELVRERLARFDAESADVLRWAAVLSPRITVDALARLSELDSGRVGVALEMAERQAMLTGGEDGMRFSHNLVARGVYNEISPLRRQVMHRRVARLLEENTALDLDYAADLVHHALHSGDAGLAARSMVLAGKLCLRFFANEEALSHARKGLQLAAGLAGAERVRVSIDLHNVMLSAAPIEDWDAAADEYVHLAEQALDHGALGHARLGYHMASVLRWEHGQWSGAREQSLQAARVIRGGSDEHNVIGLAETAKCLAMLERDLPQADAMLMEAQALAGRKHVRHHSIPMGLGLLRLHEDRLEEAEERFLEARTLCKSAGDRISEFQALEHLVLIAWYRGNFEQAAERCRALMDLGSRLREGSEEPLARALNGLCAYHERDEAGQLDEALDDLRKVDAKHRLAYMQSRAALVDLERGRAESAHRRASEALACAELLQRPTEMLIAHMVLCRACKTQGDRDGSAHHKGAMAALAEQGVAAWARQQAARLCEEQVDD